MIILFKKKKILALPFEKTTMQGGFVPPHCGFLQPREKSGPNGALHRQHCVQDRCCHSEAGDHGAGQTEEKGGAGKAAGRGGRGKWSSATQTL